VLRNSAALRQLRLFFAAAPTMVAAMADLEEVMRFDPDEGIANLDMHLDRLKSAADAQGFKFDRHAARNELQAATFGKRRAATARLLLSPTGAMAIEVTTS
jgi:branched-subunit amino acid aminotransferase/4-amino-4-deoxychorismate lyase